jgi:hypothetical protein
MTIENEGPKLRIAWENNGCRAELEADFETYCYELHKN